MATAPQVLSPASRPGSLLPCSMRLGCLAWLAPTGGQSTLPTGQALPLDALALGVLSPLSGLARGWPQECRWQSHSHADPCKPLSVGGPPGLGSGVEAGPCVRCPPGLPEEGLSAPPAQPGKDPHLAAAP